MMLRYTTNRYHKILAVIALSVVLLLPESFAQAANLSESVGSYVSEWMFDMCVGFGSFILFMGGWMLDSSIYFLLIKMGTYFGGHSFGQAVGLGWTLIRDLMNMAFIFGLVYLGIKTILSSQDSNTRRNLGLLLIAALLVNFSLFFTQMIVDVTNIAAVAMYNQIIVTDTTSIQQKFESVIDTPISNAFNSGLGFTSWLSEDTIKTFSKQKPMTLMIFSLLVMIFYAAAGWAFAMGAVLVIVRFIALIMFMVFSPLMFLSWILPSQQKVTGKWWELFLQYALQGPVYLLFLLLSLEFTLQLTRDNEGRWAELFTRINKESSTMSTDLSQLFIYFFIMIGLVILSVRVSQKLSIVGSSMAMTAVNHATAVPRQFIQSRGAAAARNMYDVTNRVTNGALSNMGGERVRQPLDKYADVTAFGGSRKANEAAAKDGLARMRTQRREADMIKKLKENNDATGLTDREVVSYLDEPDKLALLEKAAEKGNINLSAIKAIKGSDKIDAALADKLKSKNKAGIITKSKDKNHPEGFKEALKQMDNNAQEVGKLMNELGDDMLEDHIVEELSKHRGTVLEMGKHIDDPDKVKKLKDAITSKNPKLTGALDNSQFWKT